MGECGRPAMRRGRFTTVPANILTLTHTGARTGKRRENLLTYFTDGEGLIVMASDAGWRGPHVIGAFKITIGEVSALAE